MPMPVLKWISLCVVFHGSDVPGYCPGSNLNGRCLSFTANEGKMPIPASGPDKGYGVVK